MNVAFNPDEMHELSFEGCGLNVADEIILAQVNENIRRGLPQVMGYPPNVQTAILVAGGPSLKATEQDLVEAYWRGGKVVTVNGAYNWCIERNIRPSMQVVLDARESSVRFVERPVEQCHYFLASQVHPKAFEICRDRQVTLLHCCSTGDGEFEMLKEFYFGRLNPVTIGTTVAIRAITLLCILGFMRMEIFGLDSCVLGDGNHHAYEQPENDGEPVFPIWLRIKDRDDLAQRFFCTVWQARQAQDFMQLVEERGNLFQARVHGPGLIATMLRLGAEMDIAESLLPQTAI